MTYVFTRIDDDDDKHLADLLIPPPNAIRGVRPHLEASNSPRYAAVHISDEESDDDDSPISLQLNEMLPPLLPPLLLNEVT